MASGLESQTPGEIRCTELHNPNFKDFIADVFWDWFLVLRGQEGSLGPGHVASGAVPGWGRQALYKAKGDVAMHLMDLYGKTLQKEVQSSDSQLCRFQNVIFEFFLPPSGERLQNSVLSSAFVGPWSYSYSTYFNSLKRD